MTDGQPGKASAGQGDSGDRAAEHERIARTLRAELERTTPRTPKLFELPLAEKLSVPEPPEVATAGQHACGAEARTETAPRAALDTVAVRDTVCCARPEGHGGPHWSAGERGLLHRHRWQYFRWEQESVPEQGEHP